MFARVAFNLKFERRFVHLLGEVVYQLPKRHIRRKTQHNVLRLVLFVRVASNHYVLDVVNLTIKCSVGSYANSTAFLLTVLEES